MVFAHDEIRGPGDSLAGFGDRKQELWDALRAVSEGAGDQGHLSGPADYLVRIAPAQWAFHPTPAANAFIVVDNVDDIVVFERIGETEPRSVAVLHRDSDWFTGIREAFEDFRERIDK